MIDIPWPQLTQLGAGGMIIVIVLNMTFKFINVRKSVMEQILLKMDASEGRMATAVERIANAIGNQTKLVEKMYDKQNDNYVDIIKELNNGSISRRAGEMSKGN